MRGGSRGSAHWQATVRVLALVLALVCLDAPHGIAQQPAAEADGPAPAEGGDADREAIAQNVFSRPDRSSVQRLSSARQLVEQRRYAEAVRHLGTILESSEDFFLPGTSAVRQRSLRVDAQRILGEMPREGRELYELEYGARARQLLSEAAAAGDPVGLAEISRRFFHTRAGYEATLLLGLYHLDHATPMAGALALERLQQISPVADEFEPALSLSMATCWMRAGRPEKARQTLSRLKARQPGIEVEVGGKRVPLFAREGEALEWLARLTGTQASVATDAEQWPMLRGNPARNASVAGSGPLLSLRWRVATTEDPFIETLIDQLTTSPREQDRGAIPSLQPLVVDNTVLMRTVHNLLAVDFRTGKRIWEVPVDDPFEGLKAGAAESAFAQPMTLDNALKYRLWADATYGTLSSDGRRVYAIEDLKLDLGLAAARQFFNMPAGRSVDGPRSYNRLAAFDIRSGKLQWHLGGSAEEFGLPQAGTFFLGPPLPLMGRLYVLGEARGEIRLLALDAKSGQVLWTQQLAVVDRGILNDPARRLAGASPSYADGILVCPTSNRSIVAMDLATRSLLWGYTYKDKGESGTQPMFPGFPRTVDVDPMARWNDAHVTLAEGYVLATPPDSDRLHCLSLIDGKLLWTEPRDEDLYLACVHQGKVVLVGQRRVRALRLADHGPGWSRPAEFPVGSAPSGTGFLSGDAYYVPMDSGEVLAIHLPKGQIAHVYKSRRGSVPGNLTCFGDKIISQRPGALETFFQMDALGKQVSQRLAANPKDAEALALRGEMKWDEGNLEEAVQHFRRSLASGDDDGPRALLREALFEGLRSDFTTYRKSVEEIERLIEEPQQRATFYWLLAAGCENAGEYRNAFGHYLKLVDLDRKLADPDRGRQEMEQADRFLSVRRDRWIQVQLAALRSAAPPEVQREIDEEAQRRLAAAGKDGTANALVRFLDYFGGLPVAGAARNLLIAQYRRSGNLLAAELALRPLERSTDRQQAGAAVALSAAILVDAERYADAAAQYRRLEEEFADVVCQDGRTGRQIVEALPADHPARRARLGSHPWPQGEVKVVQENTKRPPQETYSRSALELAGSPSPFFSDLVLELHHNPPQVVARDGTGQRRWHLSMLEATRTAQYPFNRGATRAAVQGHLMVLAMGPWLMGVDTLGVGANGTPRVVWSKSLDELAGEGGRGQQIRAQLGAAGLGPAQRMQLQFGFASRPAGALASPTVPGMIHEQLICFQRYQSCVAVQPLTGERLWIRKDVRPDSVVFGDEQYVFLVPPDQSPATVVRATDGKFLGKRQVPAERIATLGRRVVVWHETDSQSLLELVDPWDDRRIWKPRPFAGQSKITLVDEELAGVVEPGGRFVLVELATGRALVDAQVEPERSLADIHVLRSPYDYVLVTNAGEREEPMVRRTYALHGMASAPIHRGRVYAFSRQGKPLWRKPVEIKDQFLLLAQPKQLPLVAFACMAQIQQPNGVNQQITSVLCLDRHSGRALVRDEMTHATNTFLLSGDAEKNTVELRLQLKTLTMTYTGRPWAADAPADVPLSPAAARGKSAGLFDALQRAAGSALERALGKPEAEKETENKPRPVTPR